MDKSQKNSTFQWPYGLLCFLLFLGTVAALRLTWHHEKIVYGKQEATIGLCPENQTISCDLINTSSYSELFGIPIALFAVPTYLFLIFLILFRKRIQMASSAIVLIGAATTLYSVFLAKVSLLELGFACLWCFFLYAVNLSVLVLGIAGLFREKALFLNRFQVKQFVFSLTAYAVLFVFSVGGQRLYRQNLQESKKMTSLFTEAKELKSSVIGKCLPAFTFSDVVSGNSYRLGGLNATTKPVFLVFWSATCGHCVKEMPELSAFFEGHPDLFNLVTVTKMKSQQRVGDLSFRDFTLQFAKEIGMNAPILNDPGLLSELLQVEGTPTSFLLDQNGQIKQEWKGTIPNLRATLTELSRNIASIAPEPCTENLVVTKPELNWKLSLRGQESVSLKKLLRAPTMLLVFSSLKDLETPEFEDFLKFSKRIHQQGWDYLLVSLEKLNSKRKIEQKIYFTSEENSQPGIYLLAPNGSLLKTYSGMLDWKNITFQEQVFTWLQNS